jgi:hypothetical protein
LDSSYSERHLRDFPLKLIDSGSPTNEREWVNMIG